MFNYFKKRNLLVKALRNQSLQWCAKLLFLFFSIYCQAQSCEQYISEANDFYENHKSGIDHFAESDAYFSNFVYHINHKNYPNCTDFMVEELLAAQNFFAIHKQAVNRYNALDKASKIIHTVSAQKAHLRIDYVIKMSNMLRLYNMDKETVPLLKQLFAYYKHTQNPKKQIEASLYLLDAYVKIEDFDAFNKEFKFLKQNLAWVNTDASLRKRYNFVLANYYMHIGSFESSLSYANKLVNAINKDREEQNYIRAQILKLKIYQHFNQWDSANTPTLLYLLQETNKKLRKSATYLETLGQRERYIFHYTEQFDLYYSIVVDNEITDPKIITELLRFQSMALDAKGNPKTLSNLKNNELQLDYVSYRYHNGIAPSANSFYAVFVRDMNGIRINSLNVLVEEELSAELKNKLPSQIYNNRSGGVLGGGQSNKSLYDLIIKPIAQEFNDKEVLYISTSGLLNQVSFAALSNGEFDLIEKYNVRRMATNLDISEKRKNTIEPKSIALYGNINYALKDSKKNQEVIPDGVYDMYRKNLGDWGSLPYTKTEINEIEKIASLKGIPSSIYEKNNALESSVNNLDVKRADVLHFATHGFTISEELESDYRDIFIYNSEKSLNLTGLVLTGGNYASKSLNYNGILTANEITKLNLTKTKLAVLSACETGLGESVSYEGVFGLQRAFKIAGVNNIIMSLWKVSDEGTALFMKHFYNFWLKENETIINAFRMAQLKMKRNFGPEIWAAFIFLE